MKIYQKLFLTIAALISCFSINCAPPIPISSCANGVQDGTEIAPDCGGECPLCTYCYNKIRDNDETGIDCGGNLCNPCTCFNGILDGNETQIDCGGPCGSCSASACDIVRCECVSVFEKNSMGIIYPTYPFVGLQDGFSHPFSQIVTNLNMSYFRSNNTNESAWIILNVEDSKPQYSQSSNILRYPLDSIAQPTRFIRAKLCVGGPPFRLTYQANARGYVIFERNGTFVKIHACDLWFVNEKRTDSVIISFNFDNKI